MRTKTMIFIAALSVLTSLTVESCNSPAEKLENAENKADKANEELEIANEEYLADIEAYRIETAEKIAKNDSSILAFKKRMKIEKKEAMEDYEIQLAELEEKNIELEKKMDEYNGHGESNWEIFKDEFNREVQELQDALDDLDQKNPK